MNLLEIDDESIIRDGQSVRYRLYKETVNLLYFDDGVVFRKIRVS